MSSRQEIGEISVKSCKLEWKIDNFFSYRQDMTLESPDFPILDTMWYLKISPDDFIESSSKEYVSLCLRRRDYKIPQTIEYRLGLKNVNNTIDYERVEIATFIDCGWGYPEFVKRSDLLQRKCELVPSGSLTVACTVTGKNVTSNLDSSKYKLEIIFHPSKITI